MFPASGLDTCTATSRPSGRVPARAAAEVADVFTTTRSPAVSCSASDRNRVCVTPSGPATSSRTSERASPRASAGSVADSSSGSVKVVVAACCTGVMPPLPR